MGGKNALTGALIGLSRATYGDTEPDERTWRLLAEGLAALGFLRPPRRRSGN